MILCFYTSYEGTGIPNVLVIISIYDSQVPCQQNWEKSSLITRWFNCFCAFHGMVLWYTIKFLKLTSLRFHVIFHVIIFASSGLGPGVQELFQNSKRAKAYIIQNSCYKLYKWTQVSLLICIYSAVIQMHWPLTHNFSKLLKLDI